MPYARFDQVKALASNLRERLDQTMFETIAGMVDSDLDGELSNSFRWPLNGAGVDLRLNPPVSVRVVAELLTAARVESRQYAVNEAGQAVANPYARSLERDGRQKLKRIMDGHELVPELERSERVGAQGAPPAFFPVSTRGGRR